MYRVSFHLQILSLLNSAVRDVHALDDLSALRAGRVTKANVGGVTELQPRNIPGL
jgi:hypothetical protein